MKRITIYLLSVVTILMFGLIACGGGEEPKDEENNDSIEASETTTDDQPVTLDLSAGQKVFDENCKVCHQANGEGVEGTFPPLAKSDYMLADKMRAVKQAIYGSKEPITVNGVEYPGGVMTIIELTDQQVVDVMNFVFNSWGNKGETVTVEDVKAVRE